MKWIREADADIADALSSAKIAGIAGMYLQRARGRGRHDCSEAVLRRDVVVGCWWDDETLLVLEEEEWVSGVEDRGVVY